jgi:uncharacterized protein (TIGR02145 family)
MKERNFIIIILVFLMVLFSSMVGITAKLNVSNPIEEVRIGNQVWMTKNLDVVTFRNGDTITEARTLDEWRLAASKKQPACCYYENNSENNAQYGKLYNWYAVSDPRGLAPIGWHIPTGSEWLQLRDYLDGATKDSGAKLKSTSGWEKDKNGTNSSGFNGLPGGTRDTNYFIVTNNGFGGKGTSGVWWARDRARKGDDIFNFWLSKSDRAKYFWDSESVGVSVRCVKD